MPKVGKRPVVQHGSPEWKELYDQAIGDGKAYDDSNKKPKRALSARERDVMVRVLRNHVKECIERVNSGSNWEFELGSIAQMTDVDDALILTEVIDVINPRRD